MIAALYVRKDTVYHALAGVDPWDVMRNARYWPGGTPCVAHPPCGQWGNLRWNANRDDAEKGLGLLAVEQVRANGGVLEHPKGSSLWTAAALPKPGDPPDAWGGFTLAVDQFRFGHRALKPTWLYIVGVLPPMPPMPTSEPECQMGTSRRKSGKPGIEGAEREHTPRLFAEWLVELARDTRRTA